MLQSIVDYIMGVFQSQDQIGLVAMLAIVVIAGLMLSAFGGLVRYTLIALVAFAAVMIGRKIVMDGAEPVSLVQQSSQDFTHLTMGTFLVYFVAFAVVIGAIYLIKSAVRRGAH